ncbi:BPSS1780 family membrane protein [Cognatazoarcus halotolerans]|uniref:BPSS1780 family membrane protein n=1 Tax=Cognatazoarcus halotolerans TaxID=2686016 RepID=UPI00135A9485|nr:BPSS1780 family membrane protein [Cognatazoarcus halotolerans]MCB1898570.1 hypothetical protein [Rhodocyclaceae bacterium]MCP5307723.1 hypothetical protein [Zoogloeaceae bacterium]
MQLNTLPASRGWLWIVEGFRLWKRNPALMTFLTFGYLLILLVVSLLPFIGQPLATLLMPALSLGVLNGARGIARGQKGGPDLMFSGFRTNLQSLLTIGGIYLIASLLALLATGLVDGGLLVEVMTGTRKIDSSLSDDPRFTFAMLTGITLSTPVMMAYWFAPLLAGWHHLPAPKSLFFSFVACARNWRAMFVYSLGLFVVGGVLPGILVGLLSLVSPTLGALASVPMPLIMIPIVFATFYPNARDVFGDAQEVLDATRP